MTTARLENNQKISERNKKYHLDNKDKINQKQREKYLAKKPFI